MREGKKTKSGERPPKVAAPLEVTSVIERELETHLAMIGEQAEKIRLSLDEFLGQLSKDVSEENVRVLLGDPSADPPRVTRSRSRLLKLMAQALDSDLSELFIRLYQAHALRIKQPPGNRLLKLADFFCSPKTMRLTVNPLVADWQAEYFEALKQGREWKARWTSVRYYCAFGKTFALDKVFGMLKAVSSAFTSR